MAVLVPYANIAQLLVSLALIGIILLQTRGTGFAASYSPDSSIFRTRRGLERTLFQVTIGLAVVFVAFAIVNVFLARAEL